MRPGVLVAGAFAAHLRTTYNSTEVSSAQDAMTVFMQTKACPISLPVRRDDEEGYFDELFAALQKGHPEGTLKAHACDEFKNQLKCQFASMLKTNCDGMQSKYEERKDTWYAACTKESTISTPETINAKKGVYWYDADEVTKLLTVDEKKYFFGMFLASQDTQKFNTAVDLCGMKKEGMCTLMKVVDDGCANGLSFGTPRFGHQEDIERTTTPAA
mmetsp:Transcript_132453/g.301100  ORF Transcript_132453/g.301100 Transcript_132453/m.301100 type:complete len:215 (-) Transcript_132453:104-748(-)